jgi:hypothetical protein
MPWFDHYTTGMCTETPHYSPWVSTVMSLKEKINLYKKITYLDLSSNLGVWIWTNDGSCAFEEYSYFEVTSDNKD